MKKFCALLMAVCLVASVASTASANYVLQNGDQVKVAQKLSPGGYGGGPFKLEVVSPVLNPIPSFISFCLEKSETIEVGQTYSVTVDAYAIKGGADSNSLPPLNGDANKDYLSYAAGTLYQAFRVGDLTSAILGWTGSVADQVALQNAFWTLEDEGVTVAEDGFGTPGMTATLVAWAIANANPGNWTRVINLTDATGAHRQSMMTLVPEPASVAVWGFIATVFGGGMYLRRRRSKS